MALSKVSSLYCPVVLKGAHIFQHINPEHLLEEAKVLIALCVWFLYPYKGPNRIIEVLHIFYTNLLGPPPGNVYTHMALDMAPSPYLNIAFPAKSVIFRFHLTHHADASTGYGCECRVPTYP